MQMAQFIFCPRKKKKKRRSLVFCYFQTIHNLSFVIWGWIV